MLDPKMALGALITLSATAGTWIEQANSYGQLVLTVLGVVVGLLTVWYTWERAIKLREERRREDQ